MPGQELKGCNDGNGNTEERSITREQEEISYTNKSCMNENQYSLKMGNEKE